MLIQQSQSRARFVAFTHRDYHSKLRLALRAAAALAGDGGQVRPDDAPALQNGASAGGWRVVLFEIRAWRRQRRVGHGWRAEAGGEQGQSGPPHIDRSEA